MDVAMLRIRRQRSIETFTQSQKGFSLTQVSNLENNIHNVKNILQTLRLLEMIKFVNSKLNESNN